MDTSTMGTIKAFSYALLVPLFTYTGLSSELTSILTVLIGLDITTAMLRELAIGNQIASQTLWVGIVAKLLLILVPFILILIGKGAGVNLLQLGKLTLSTFIVAEGYSVIGNIIQVRKGDKTITEQVL